MANPRILTHPSVCEYKDLQTLCQPLSLLDIHYFAHVRVNHQREFAGLGLLPEYAKHYLEKKYYNYDYHLLEAPQKESFILWDAIEITKETKASNDDLMNLGFGHGFTILQKNEGAIDCYHFATHLGNTKANQHYFQRIDLLKNFISYFKDAVKKTRSLSLAYKHTFKIEKSIAQCHLKNELVSNHENDFLNAIQSNRFFVTQDRHITQREWTCLALISEGLTFKQAAETIQTTERTVKAHIDHLKKKLNCKTLFQLGAKFETLSYLLISNERHQK